MRFLTLFAVVALALFAALPAKSCTLFKVTLGGKTIVGNNEDAWSINARIRFEKGRNGELGGVYFSHYNGSPMRRMTDQGGMNEAGLMFDGFAVPVTPLRSQAGKSSADVQALVAAVMHTCSNVHQAADIFRRYDLGIFNGGMLFLCDSTGEYLVVEADTLFTGNDATYAVGNFRASQCTDFNAVPIARYQRGRRVLASGPDTSLAYCTAVIDSMRACRKKLGEGTLYSYLADLDRGIVHVFFYHDFSRHVTFNLKDELAKGDHELEMASLFPANAEYVRLLAFNTPMHQRWMFWSLVCIAAIMFISSARSGMRLLLNVIKRLRRKPDPKPVLSDLLAIASAAIIILLVAPLLLREGVYYFGLGDALDPIHPALKYLPWLLIALTLGLAAMRWPSTHRMRERRFKRWSGILQTSAQVVFVVFLTYWGMVL